jgi:hypothetical protein
MKDDIRKRARQELQDKLGEHARAIEVSGIVERVSAMQDPMVEAARSCFSESELDDLRSVIRLSLEFHDYLENPNTEPNKLTYVCESILWGIESFMSLTRAYKVLAGAADTKIEWGAISMPSLKERFFATFQEFVAETDFENKCRILLDLFKLQIVFAGMLYD